MLLLKLNILIECTAGYNIDYAVSKDLSCKQFSLIYKIKSNCIDKKLIF